MCFFNENVSIAIRISQKLVHKIPIPINQHWLRQWLTDDKPLSEPMRAYFTDTYMCQWVNTMKPCQSGFYFAATFLNSFSCMKIVVWIKTSIKFVPKRPMTKSSLVYFRQWFGVNEAPRQPLCEPMMAQFTDTQLCQIISKSTYQGLVQYWCKVHR